MDISRGEMVEKELDAMIERRSRQKDSEEEHELWKESVRRHNARRQEELRSEWVATTSTRPHATGPLWRPS